MNAYTHLESYLQRLEQIMESELSKEDPQVYGLLIPFIKRGGKRIRPVMCLLSCGAVGGKYSAASEASALIELFHNFTLIHDDIEDNSLYRRGQPTLHISYGVPMALNSGDALYTLLIKKMVSIDLSPPSKRHIFQSLCANAFKRVVEGQGIELYWIRNGRFDITEEEYLKMIAGKTSALMGLSCEAGAFFAGARKRERTALAKFGEKIGLAFQIHDDVLNLIGDFEQYKKEIGGDISEGKRTLIVVHCLARASLEDKSRLIEILRSQTKDQLKVQEAIAILKKYGSIDHAASYAKRLAEEAKAHLERFSESQDKSALLSIADYSVSRNQ